MVHIAFLTICVSVAFRIHNQRNPNAKCISYHLNTQQDNDILTYFFLKLVSHWPKRIALVI